MVKICFYHGNKEIHLLGCHFQVPRAHVWCISCFGQHRDVIKLRLLEHCYQYQQRHSFVAHFDFSLGKKFCGYIFIKFLHHPAVVVNIIKNVACMPWYRFKFASLHFFQFITSLVLGGILFLDSFSTV